MPALRDLQQAFMGYLLENPSSIVDNIVSSGGYNAQQRLDLYADGYKLRLKEAMMTDYEQLHTYLGDDMFEQLMDSYIIRYPSHHPSLRYFSKSIPLVLLEEEPWKNIPVLYELAVIEKAFCDSFDAADAQVILPQELSKLSLDDWPGLKVQFHESVQLLSMKHNSIEIWQALSNSDIPPAVEQESVSWLIWRKALISQYRAITEAEMRALNTMLAGGDFGELCEVLLEFYSEEETPQQAIALLQGWMSSEMVSQIEF